MVVFLGPHCGHSLLGLAIMSDPLYCFQFFFSFSVHGDKGIHLPMRDRALLTVASARLQSTDDEPHCTPIRHDTEQ